MLYLFISHKFYKNIYVKLSNRQLIQNEYFFRLKKYIYIKELDRISRCTIICISNSLIIMYIHLIMSVYSLCTYIYILYISASNKRIVYDNIFERFIKNKMKIFFLSKIIILSLALYSAFLLYICIFFCSLFFFLHIVYNNLFWDSLFIFFTIYRLCIAYRSIVIVVLIQTLTYTFSETRAITSLITSIAKIWHKFIFIDSSWFVLHILKALQTQVHNETILMSARNTFCCVNAGNCPGTSASCNQRFAWCTKLIKPFVFCIITSMLGMLEIDSII